MSERSDDDLCVRRDGPGGFRLERGGRVVARVAADGAGFAVLDAARRAVARLERQTGGGEPGHFRLVDRDAPERSARVEARAGTGQGPDMRYLLWGDGRLFRLAPRGARAVRFELSGWETPGPYLIARPESEGWVLETTPSGRGLKETRSLSVLIAAEILDLEDPLVAAESP